VTQVALVSVNGDALDPVELDTITVSASDPRLLAVITLKVTGAPLKLVK